MDIHFCDLCGARVTDVDLRGGHGICRQYDVICATCVELGHGKEWLANSQQRQQQRSATASSQPAPVAAKKAVAAATAEAVITAENVINTANDRAQTLEEGQESESVAPQVIEADDFSEHDDGNLIAENTPESAPVLNNQFASAASSFSAMGKQSQSSANDDDVDGSEQGEGLADESTAAPILADSTDDTSASPFEFTEKKDPSTEDDWQSQKDETLPSDRDPIMAEKPASSSASSRKSTSASASFKRNGSKSSSNNPRASSSKSGKASPKGSGRSRAKNKNKNIVMLSAISVGILFMIGLIVMASLSKPRGDQVIDRVDLSENVKMAIKDAKVNAIVALKSKDVAKLKAAKEQIQAIRPEIYKFADEAKKNNWTDDEMGRYMDNVGWPDVNSLQRNISDEIAKQSH